MDSILKGERLSVLLIDDDEDDCNDFKETILKLGALYQLSIANNPDNLFAYIEECKPDLIFLDINMQSKDGIQCLRELKAHDKHKAIPIIMYSTSDDERFRDQCLQLGAHHYLVKPYAIINLAVSLKKIFTQNWKIAQSLPSKDNFVIGLEYK